MTDIDGFFIVEPNTGDEYVAIFEQGHFQTPIALIPIYRWRIIQDRIDKAMNERIKQHGGGTV